MSSKKADRRAVAAGEEGRALGLRIDSIRVLVPAGILGALTFVASEAIRSASLRAHAPAALRDELVSPASVTGPARSSAPPTTAGATAPEREERIRAYFERLENTWQTEALDPQWSAAIEATLTKTLETHVLLSHATRAKVGCRRTLCRVEAQISGPGRDNFVHILQVASGLPEASSRPLEGGGTIAYLARQALPPF